MPLNKLRPPKMEMV